VDLARDVDPAAGVVGLGRLATYDASNVKATTNVTLGATINALLVVGDNITVTVPAGGTTITSGEVVNVGGASGNTISGGTLAFGGAEPLFFAQGVNTVQQLNLNGATSGLFSLTMVLNSPSAPAPVTGTTQLAPVTPQTTVLLDI